jgi:hypothetical protein
MKNDTLTLSCLTITISVWKQDETNTLYNLSSRCGPTLVAQNWIGLKEPLQAILLFPIIHGVSRCFQWIHQNIHHSFETCFNMLQWAIGHKSISNISLPSGNPPWLANLPFIVTFHQKNIYIYRGFFPRGIILLVNISKKFQKHMILLILLWFYNVL